MKKLTARAETGLFALAVMQGSVLIVISKVKSGLPL